ncbi:hypothetical protein JTE90_020127 [Oedothorax gibbosus]|uniref:Uncharacterized protein n=1 Tax=Oedothorax gibbosus TaxID=931172 RepID=A0AAV6VMD3_9ARAC|nr:hypothetical protein JTE90_020127 [Oedothorax gibbosus]
MATACTSILWGHSSRSNRTYIFFSYQVVLNPFGPFLISPNSGTSTTKHTCHPILALDTCCPPRVIPVCSLRVISVGVPLINNGCFCPPHPINKGSTPSERGSI